MGTRLLLLTITFQQPSSILPQAHSWPVRNPNFYTFTSQNPNLLVRIRRIYTTTRYRRWDANAETVRTQRFNFRIRNNDDGADEDEDDENDDVSWEVDKGSGVFEEFIDSVYIFKVFRSFGWMLPAIILSMLFATGPKAFLMALALPLGQSALSLAFKKLSSRRPKRKSRAKKKPSGSSASAVEMNEEQEKGQGTRKGKTGYQSWVVGNDGSVRKDGQEAPNFGGWEELDKQRDFDMGSSQRPDRTTGRSQKTPVQKGRLSRRERKGNSPLLLRLLIAVFPFLGSWTKLI